MGKDLKGNYKMELKMDMEFIHILMVTNTRECGKMIEKMEKEYIFIKLLTKNIKE